MERASQLFAAHIFFFNPTILAHSLVSYFVVFYKQGFSPRDLRKAQAAGGQLQYNLFLCILKFYCTVYFTKSSPDFINSRGRSIVASSQIDALGQAQSIGESFFLLICSISEFNENNTVYLSIFIVQCFNVRLAVMSFSTD